MRDGAPRGGGGPPAVCHAGGWTIGEAPGALRSYMFIYYSPMDAATSRESSCCLVPLCTHIHGQAEGSSRSPDMNKSGRYKPKHLPLARSNRDEMG